MKRCIYLSLLLFAAFSEPAMGQSQEFSKTEVSVDAESSEIGNKLADTKALGFDSWLDIFEDSGWTLLHSAQSELFHCAIFRSEHHVIIWFTDRKDLLKQTSTGVYSDDFGPERDDRIAKIGPSKWAIAKRKINWPTGGLTATDNAMVFEIEHALDGWLQIEVNGTDNSGKRRKVFYCEIPWSKIEQ